MTWMVKGHFTSMKDELTHLLNWLSSKFEGKKKENTPLKIHIKFLEKPDNQATQKVSPTISIVLGSAR